MPRGKQLELPSFADAVAKMDADGDGALSRDELEERRVKAWFQFQDLDRSGGLDADEWRLCRASFASVNAAKASAIPDIAANFGFVGLETNVVMVGWPRDAAQKAHYAAMISRS